MTCRRQAAAGMAALLIYLGVILPLVHPHLHDDHHGSGLAAAGHHHGCPVCGSHCLDQVATLPVVAAPAFARLAVPRHTCPPSGSPHTHQRLTDARAPPAPPM